MLILKYGKGGRYNPEVETKTKATAPSGRKVRGPEKDRKLFPLPVSLQHVWGQDQPTS